MENFLQTSYLWALLRHFLRGVHRKSWQIGIIKRTLEEALHKSKIPSAPTSEVLRHESAELAIDLVYVIRKHVESRSSIISRSVSVRNRTPEEVYVHGMSWRNKHISVNVIASMPKRRAEEVEVTFFKVSRKMSDEELEKEFKKRRLVPVDPVTLAAVNEADETFGDTRPNGTHWKDEDGNWCRAIFGFFNKRRYMDVFSCHMGWDESFWVGGVAY